MEWEIRAKTVPRPAQTRAKSAHFAGVMRTHGARADKHKTSEAQEEKQRPALRRPLQTRSRTAQE
jgi:hypothetical protein